MLNDTKEGMPITKWNVIRRWELEYHTFRDETKKTMEEWRLYECVVMYETIRWAIDNELDQELVEWLWHSNITLDRIVDWYISGDYATIKSRVESIVFDKLRKISIDKASKV